MADSKLDRRKTTPKVIKSIELPPDSKRRQHYVVLEPAINLYLSVTHQGSKSFFFRKKVDGSWKNIDLGIKFNERLDDTALRLTIQAAQAKASQLAAEYGRGQDPFALAQSVAQEPTFQELFDHYFKDLAKRGRNTAEATGNFKRWFGHLASKKATKFSFSEANAMHDELSTRRKKLKNGKIKEGTKTTANRMVQFGHGMFNHAIQTRFVKMENPFDGISKNKETARDRFLSADEAAKLMEVVTDVPPRHCKERTFLDFMLLLMSTGVRKDNMLTMRFDEIDQVHWTWSIPAEKMKGEKKQTIKLAPFEIAVIEDRIRIHREAGIITPWVFPSTKSNTGHLVDPGNAWESLRAKLGMPDVTFHDLRRSLASAMLETGADTTLVQRTLSHADPRTTAKHYIRTTQQAELDARLRVHEMRTAKVSPKSSTNKNMKDRQG